MRTVPWVFHQLNAFESEDVVRHSPYFIPGDDVFALRLNMMKLRPERNVTK